MNLKLFLFFSKIGIFTIGGGHAVIPLIEKDIVDRDLINQKEFYELIAVTESLPGVFATNLAALVGYRINGLRGSLLAALGTILAPFFIIIIIALFFQKFNDNIWIEKAFKALRPAVIALIVSPLFSIAKANKLTIKKLLLPLAALLLMIFFGISPVWIIIITGLVSLLYSINSVTK